MFGQSQILPNKATDNSKEFAQSKDLHKLLFLKNYCLKKTKRGGRLKIYKVSVKLIQKVKE